MRPIGFALLLATAAACGNSRGDLTVRWKFDNGSSTGLDCDQVGVSYVQVDIANQILSPNQFDCVSGNTVTGGAFLGRYPIGTYTVTITGFDQGNFILYQNTFDIHVDGRGTDVTVDLGQPTLGSVTLDYTFAGQSCAAAGVDTVSVSIDGSPLVYNNSTQIPCQDANGASELVIDQLAVGEHTFRVLGFAQSPPPYDSGFFSVDVRYNQNAIVPINLH
jgi:hypothetical protein